MAPSNRQRRPRLGLALGSGAARGWAHIGVLRGLEAAGVVPAVVCGTSIGALVGAAYCAGELDALEAWARRLEWRTVLGFFDLYLRGGLIRARRLFEAFAAEIPDRPIETLPKPFAAVATDLATGQEVWLREGSMLEAVRASVALPGLVAPVRLEGRWLVDGGLVNPVPVSACRALGAEVVMAVDLNTTLLGRRFKTSPPAPSPPAAEPSEEEVSPVTSRNLRDVLHGLAADLRSRFFGDEAEDRDDSPTMYDVMANAINIMQVRITRSRMAGDPPELLVTPRLHRFGLLDFDRAAEAIEEGRRAVAQALASGVLDGLA